jgi:hypothetical protein
MTVVDVNHFLYATHDPGPFTAPSPRTGEGAVLTGAFADPNGNVTPADPTLAAWYYQDGQALVWWQWSVADQVWYQGSG